MYVLPALLSTILAHGDIVDRRTMGVANHGATGAPAPRKISVMGYPCMEITEILHQFERATGRFAQTAVEAAVARREEITPELLRVLEDTVDRAAELDAEGGYMAHLYAMFLLAQFREARAYSLVVRFASLPGDGATPVNGSTPPRPPSRAWTPRSEAGRYFGPRARLLMWSGTGPVKQRGGLIAATETLGQIDLCSGGAGPALQRQKLQRRISNPAKTPQNAAPNPKLL
jgi:hypothetical protein